MSSYDCIKANTAAYRFTFLIYMINDGVWHHARISKMEASTFNDIMYIRNPAFFDTFKIPFYLRPHATRMRVSNMVSIINCTGIVKSGFLTNINTYVNCSGLYLLFISI